MQWILVGVLWGSIALLVAFCYYRPTTLNRLFPKPNGVCRICGRPVTPGEYEHDDCFNRRQW